MKKILVVGLVIMFMMVLFAPTPTIVEVVVADEPNCPEGYEEADSDGDGINDVCYPIDDDKPAEIPIGSHDSE